MNNALFRLCLTLFILLAQATKAAEVAQFHFNSAPLTLSDEMFNRYTLPQLRSINQEFFHMIRQLAPDANELISLREQLSRLGQQTRRFEQECPTNTVACLPQLTELYRQCRNIDQLILRHQKNSLLYSTSTEDAKIESLLWLEKSLGEISLINYQIMHRLEHQLMLTETPYSSYVLKRQSLSELTHQMLVLAELGQTILLPPSLRQDFHALWTNFIKVSEQYIIQPRQKSYYLERIEPLNMAWNNFNMRMTRGTSTLPKAQQNLLRIMHNRWNSLLGIVLR